MANTPNSSRPQRPLRPAGERAHDNEGGQRSARDRGARWWLSLTTFSPTRGVRDQVSSIGAFLLGASTLPFFYNVYISRTSPEVAVDDPRGWGRSLEWATSRTPPRRNIHSLRRIRSISPAFDHHHHHHPEIESIGMAEAARPRADPSPPEDYAESYSPTGRSS